MDLKAVEEVVSKIQGNIFKNSNSYSIGMLKSHFRGTGLQFKEHQVYCHGDDVRFIDWKLTAKTRKPYIKTFEEERNVEICVIIDTSQTMLMGYDGIPKIQAAINIACLLCLLAKETNDFIQINLLGEKDVSLPKGNGKKAIVMLISELRKLDLIKKDGSINLKYRIKEPMALERKSRIINKYLAKRKEVVLLSDFNTFLSEEDIPSIVSRKNAHSFRIICPLDKNQKTNYSVYALRPGITDEKVGLFSLKGEKKESGLKHFVGRRIHTLDLENRYMEEFIKELV